MTLALLITAVTGAWATDVYLVGNGNGNWLNGAVWDPGVAGNKMTEQNGVYSITFTDVNANSELLFKFAINGTWDVNYGCISTDENKLNKTLSNIEAFGNNILFGLTEPADVTISFNLSELTYMISTNGMKVGDDITVEPVEGTTNEWTFAMPGSNVVLTPIYAAATVYGSDGQTEKMAYETLKEAFANVQDGDVIKLDWNVTLKEPLLRSTGDGISFTLDLNGYTIDGIQATNSAAFLISNGDVMTITDGSHDQTGGVTGNMGAENGNGTIIFDAGRYSLGPYVTAAMINKAWADYAAWGWQMAEGKEFVDIENAPVDGFMFRVDYKDFELVIGPKRFATFYLDQNVKLDEATSGVTVYTVTGIDTDRSLANVSPVTGVVAKETPILLYNATYNELTAKLTVTPDAANAVDVAPEFKGTAEAREFTATDMAAADYYALVGGKAFAPVYKPGTIGANKCWLEFAKQQTPSARQLTIVFDETTGVNEVIEVNEVSDDSWYDLNGRKIQKPARKGVFIQNGKKVVK